MIKLKDLLNEWNDKSFKDLPKRWSGAYSNDDSGLTEIEQQGGRDKVIKESEGLSRGEKFGLDEVGEQIVQAHKRLNDMLFKYMGGVRKYASKHRKNPELSKKLNDLYTHIKGNYYYTTKQAAGKYMLPFEKQYKALVSEGKLNEKKPWQGYKAHAVHGKAEVDFLNLISDFPDWKKYNKLTDKGKNVIFFMRKGKDALVWQTSNGREVQATNLKGDESSYKSYKVKDIYKVLVEYRIRGNADKLMVRKGDIKKGMMVWFDLGGGKAKKLKVKHTMDSNDPKSDEEHYITNKGTFTVDDVVGY